MQCGIAEYGIEHIVEAQFMTIPYHRIHTRVACRRYHLRTGINPDDLATKILKLPR